MRRLNLLSLAVMMLVPVGVPVDSVIKYLLAHIQPGDSIIDTGNLTARDTIFGSPHLNGRNPAVPVTQIRYILAESLARAIEVLILVDCCLGPSKNPDR